MADVKISALPALTTAALTDLFAVVQGGVTYKGTLQQLVDATPDASASVRGLVSTGTQTFAGNKTFTGESSTVGNALVVNNLGGTAKFTVANAGRVSLTSDTTVTTQTVSVITTDTTNAGLVLRPNGTGAIMASAPDGTSTGGNARGTNAVDLQMVRAAATQVAGLGSVITGGSSNTSSGQYTFVGGGVSNSAAFYGSAVVAGQNNTVSGDRGFIGAGRENTINSAYSSITGGEYANTYMYGQQANASGRFVARSDAQTSAIILRRSITGDSTTTQKELFLDGSGERAILNISSPGPTNARVWVAQIDVVAVVATVGAGTVVLNDVFAGNYTCAIKRAGTSTSMVGAVNTAGEMFDTSMTTSVVTIDADDTNEALRIQFTPPSTAAADTVIRVVATCYLTEVGR